MPDQTILRIALPTPLPRLFDYLPTANLTVFRVGLRVLVPFQSRTLVGMIVEVVQKTKIARNKLKQVIEVLDTEPLLSKDVYELCQWAAQYYHVALGEVLFAALPTALRKKKQASSKKKIKTHDFLPEELPVLNSAQANAVTTILSAAQNYQTFVLDGVTGSGKTEVYLRVIEKILEKDQQVLVLVPEIGLTPQLLERFRKRLAVPIAAVHSNLSEGERLATWLATKNNAIKIVIGTRSAVFSSFANLGLIIVDEEHDPSLKQQDRFRYHARDLAVMRAKYLQIPIILGSATPSLESLLNAKRERYLQLNLPQRAGNAKLPQYSLIDLQKETVQAGLSQTLITAIQETLTSGNQVMLFLNRRGFAPILYCLNCHHIVTCQRCDMRMVYHRSPERLQCHLCDTKRTIPRKCEQCAEPALQAVGYGTQRLEELLKAQFSGIRILRIDRDTTQRRHALQDLLTEINRNEPAILLGTQMLAKGHHFSHVTLVGVVDADQGLFSADFRAVEQMGQLLTQVAGRAGRAMQAGKVLIQTRNPEHPLLKLLLEHGYQAFAHVLLRERELANLPPFFHCAIIRAESYIAQNSREFLEELKQHCPPTNTVNMAGPLSALIAKKRGLHCEQLLVSAAERNSLHTFLRQMSEKMHGLARGRQVRWILDIDPIEVV